MESCGEPLLSISLFCAERCGKPGLGQSVVCSQPPAIKPRQRPADRGEQLKDLTHLSLIFFPFYLIRLFSFRWLISLCTSEVHYRGRFLIICLGVWSILSPAFCF